MLDLAEQTEDLLVITADTSTSAGLERFRSRYPEKFLDVGIAEQNLLCVATGLASEGFNVVTATFAPFQTLRCCEQIKVNLGYMQHKVTMVGLASGVVLGTLGYTHCSIEDIAALRAIPNLTLLSPADCGETAKAVSAALSHPQSVYIRLTGGANCPVVYEADYPFEIGKAVELRRGRDASLIATGSMVHPCLRAAELLADSGIETSVLDMHTIKPLDHEALAHLCARTDLIVTVEEHSIVGGLGSAVAESTAAMRNSPRHILLGVADSYACSGEYSDILAHHGLTAHAIAERVRTELKT